MTYTITDYGEYHGRAQLNTLQRTRSELAKDPSSKGMLHCAMPNGGLARPSSKNKEFEDPYDTHSNVSHIGLRQFSMS